MHDTAVRLYGSYNLATHTSVQRICVCAQKIYWSIYDFPDSSASINSFQTAERSLANVYLSPVRPTISLLVSIKPYDFGGQKELLQ